MLSPRVIFCRRLFSHTVERLDAMRVNPWLYNLGGFAPCDNQYILDRHHGKWRVYYYERGQVLQVSEFDRCTDACDCLVNHFM